MPPLILKWHNVSVAIRIKLSADAKLVLFVLCVFMLVGISEISKVALGKFDFICYLLAGALVTGVIKDFKSNQLDVTVAEKGLGQKLTEIKKDARGEKQDQKPAPGGADDK